MSLSIETERGPASYLPPVCFGPSERSVEQMEGGSHISSIEQSIEKSKSHWSLVGDFDSDNEVAEVSNRELFKTLQRHPTWGSFFQYFGNCKGSYAEMVMGEKFAEGGQAEIYEVQIEWYDPKVREENLRQSREHVLKVFKKGTFLRHLQSQWPQGMLQHHANKLKLQDLGLPAELRFDCDLLCGTLLEDGRFAFVMEKEQEDLRNMINRRMLTRSNNEGPFSKRESLETMYGLAFGMNLLHNRGIVHRDIKASNVLVSRTGCCFIADFECSVGVVGTGFFRAPEILEAYKCGNVSTHAELFTKAVDIYSYGMTCYEILTGKLPFEDHPWNDYDLVLQGQRPKVPQYIHGWIRKLLNRCWQSNPVARPSSQEILSILLTNSTTCRKLDLFYQKQDMEAGIRKTLDRSSKIVDVWRSLTLKLPKLKMLRSCKK